ncbi:HAD family hydrolase [Glacieibacterium megasporae]|uniref:HAD family hydrolase n=1 Tax=Glacieibacterium megasporae TaxID=2835787 RepID=UPI0021034630|nr:HAD-IB family phosphatase [Polymorphobacter megasporae]
MTRVIYDMDKTITRAPTYTRWLVYWASREAPWRLGLLPLAGVAGIGFRLRLMSRGRLKEIAQFLLMGDAAPRDRVDVRAAGFAAIVVAGGLMPGAVAQLAADRADGHEIVIATASYAFYARAIAAALGIERVVATGSVWDGDLLRARLAGDNCYGSAKAVMVATAFSGERFVRAYSDHVSDAALFALADEPVAVSPSPALRRLATVRGWRVVDWR